VRLVHVRFLLAIYVKVILSGSIKTNSNRVIEFVSYSRVRYKHTSMPINFLTFFHGLRPYFGLHRAILNSISINGATFITISMLRLFFSTNFPGAMIIQGGTFIPDS
jgi:hypothetical protein